MFAAAHVAEVVEVKGPDHASAESLIHDELRLLPDRFGIVESGPLQALGGVRSHSFNFDGVIASHLPALVLDVPANLK